MVLLQAICNSGLVCHVLIFTLFLQKIIPTGYVTKIRTSFQYYSQMYEIRNRNRSRSIILLLGAGCGTGKAEIRSRLRRTRTNHTANFLCTDISRTIPLTMRTLTLRWSMSARLHNCSDLATMLTRESSI